MHSKLSCKLGHSSTKSLALNPCSARQVPCLTSRLQQRTAFQAAAQAEEAAAAPEPQQQLKAEQRQKQKQQQKPAKPGQLTQTRIKRRAAAWKDSSTPNTGLVGITQKSRAESAAACVVADLKTAVSSLYNAAVNIKDKLLLLCYYVVQHKTCLSLRNMPMSAAASDATTVTRQAACGVRRLLPHSHQALLAADAVKDMPASML